MKASIHKTSLIALFSSILSAVTPSFADHRIADGKKYEWGLYSVPDTARDASLSFKDANGNIVSVSDLQGKVVFINFWATWCAPCIEEMPTLNTLKSKFDGNEDIIFLMVDVDGDLGEAQAFMDKRNLDLPVYVPHGEIPALYLSKGIPTTIILNKRGDIVSRIEGGRDYTSPRFERALNELLAGKLTIL